MIEMLVWQETKNLAIYKHDFSSRGFILKVVFYKGNKMCYNTEFLYHRVWYCKGFAVHCLQRIDCEFISLYFQLLPFLWKQRGKFSNLGFSYY